MNAIELAKKMKERLNKNSLDLRKYKLDEKKFTKIEASDINDFPKIVDLNQIKNCLTFGSYQLKQCLSYLAEHFNKYGIYQFYKSIENIEDNGQKIIGAQLCLIF